MYKRATKKLCMPACRDPKGNAKVDEVWPLAMSSNVVSGKELDMVAMQSVD